MTFAIAKLKEQLLFGEQYRKYPTLMSQYWKNPPQKNLISHIKGRNQTVLEII